MSNTELLQYRPTERTTLLLEALDLIPKAARIVEVQMDMNENPVGMLKAVRRAADELRQELDQWEVKAEEYYESLTASFTKAA